MGSRDVRTKEFFTPKVFRGTQVIFGERKHLEEVLGSIRKAHLPKTRGRAEARLLRQLIDARTKELNLVTPGWDRKFRRASEPKTSSRQLMRLAASLSREDYLLARVISEHAEAPPELLEQWASHPYSAVRENVARHPRTPAKTLRKLAENTSEPLWFLVACNPSTPPDLRDRLRARMRETTSK